MHLYRLKSKVDRLKIEYRHNRYTNKRNPRLITGKIPNQPLVSLRTNPHDLYMLGDRYYEFRRDDDQLICLNDRISDMNINHKSSLHRLIQNDRLDTLKEYPTIIEHSDFLDILEANGEQINQINQNHSENNYKINDENYENGEVSIDEVPIDEVQNAAILEKELTAKKFGTILDNGRECICSCHVHHPHPTFQKLKDHLECCSDLTITDHQSADFRIENHHFSQHENHENHENQQYNQYNQYNQFNQSQQPQQFQQPQQPHHKSKRQRLRFSIFRRKNNIFSAVPSPIYECNTDSSQIEQLEDNTIHLVNADHIENNKTPKENFHCKKKEYILEDHEHYKNQSSEVKLTDNNNIQEVDSILSNLCNCFNCERKRGNVSEGIWKSIINESSLTAARISTGALPMINNSSKLSLNSQNNKSNSQDNLIIKENYNNQFVNNIDSNHYININDNDPTEKIENIDKFQIDEKESIKQKIKFFDNNKISNLKKNQNKIEKVDKIENFEDVNNAENIENIRNVEMDVSSKPVESRTLHSIWDSKVNLTISSRVRPSTQNSEFPTGSVYSGLFSNYAYSDTDIEVLKATTNKINSGKNENLTFHISNSIKQRNRSSIEGDKIVLKDLKNDLSII
ncbi:uncharacterized protein ASCRUDRAFT_71859 [Ascoidea rubescens DSM 1968]|uniref:Uncharacterized protein n=1 Tax=Ascoidea rubescens DSM 1968 TaxID=1344418 RepID=A0A1D2VC43_9ASCO|nr:hypothetical protein ASCRUDRAFT_71859 [Ascoidea rubescens DSM 1968]ODV59132.1 hypothetical protein ASCRUDRAFT_71859 [Ascoidea rubescens DSM 1968]